MEIYIQPSGHRRQRKPPMHPSRKTLERCIELALETGVLVEVARRLDCSTQTIRNWRRRSTESPREYMVTLPVAGGEQPFHLALRMALPSKGERARKRRHDPAFKVAPNSSRPPDSGADLCAARASPADRAARLKQATEQNPGPTDINSPASPYEPAERLGSAPSRVKIGDTAIIDGTLGKRMA